MQPGGALWKVLGRAAANELRSYYRELDAKRPNRPGGRRSHFRAAAASSVQNPVTVAGGGHSFTGDESADSMPEAPPCGKNFSPLRPWKMCR